MNLFMIESIVQTATKRRKQVDNEIKGHNHDPSEK